jgi:PDZ domain-containing protein
MKVRRYWTALLLAALMLPAAARAQEEARVRERAVREARADRGWMGILFAWDEEDDDAREARVSRVMPGSPAEKAGVRRDDVVLSIDDEPATRGTVEELSAGLEPGERVRLRLRRDGREQTVDVVAAERPGPVVVLRGDQGEVLRPGRRIGPMIVFGDSFDVDADFDMDVDVDVDVDHLLERVDSLRFHLRERAPEVLEFRMDTTIVLMRDSLLRTFERRPLVIDGERWGRELVAGMAPFTMEFGPRAIAGAEFAEMNEGLGRYFRTSEGLLVLQVAEGTPADRAGLEAGDVVVRADGRALESIGDLREAFFRGEDNRVSLEVLRQGQRRTLEVEWERSRARVYRAEPGRRLRVVPAPERRRREEVRQRSRQPNE